ncbi:MAG: ATP-binding protein, partial [Verrucomicrobiota bacterium]
MSRRFFGREIELSRLQAFAETPESGFLMVRGRRRIGKSWLLTEFAETSGAIYFQGDDGSSSRSLMRDMAQAWESHSGDDSLAIIRSVDLTWKRVFDALTRFCQENQDRQHVFIFDEIQWIAKRKSGFVGHLKEAWVRFEKAGNVKIIICGSSQRFFTKATSSDASVLHRLRTSADLWIEPFSLTEIRRHYFKRWTDEQICLVFMITGGVPYYLERIGRGNFIQAINKAFFTRETIFLDEFKEVLNLEFTKGSAQTAEAILECLGQDGSTLENIRKKSGLRSESTVRTIIDQLLTFQIVSEKTRAGERKGNRRGSKFYIKDPFLNFYFQVLRKRTRQIQRNEKTNLFGEVIGSKIGYYIEDFSGKAFELLVEWVLQQRLSPGGEEPILTKLELAEDPYEVGHYWEEGKTQVDLVVENSRDRESRLLELKWISKTADVSAGYVEQVLDKAYSPP